MTQQEKKVQMSYEIPESLKERLKIHCVKTNTPVRRFVQDLIESELSD